MNNLRTALEWYNNGTEGLFNEGEEEIAKDSFLSYSYAKTQLKGRFLLGEEVIFGSLYDIAYAMFLQDKGIDTWNKVSMGTYDKELET